jgi:hypothetical protein
LSRPGNPKRAALAAVVAVLVVGGTARAQTFPTAQSAWTPLPCGAGVMVDATNDTPGATGALDLVGTSAAPAGYHAADANFLYLRLRLAADPRQGAALQPNAWGWELDLDNNNSTYELLLSVSGIAGANEVAIYRHTGGTPNDPADPAQAPPLFTYPVNTHAEVVAAGSTLGGGQDFFLDIALPWSDLTTALVARNGGVRFWAGSSTVANALDLDLACFGGAGGTGGTGPRTLEGGPGCSVADGGRALSVAGSGALACFVLFALWLRRRARG